MDYVVLIDKNMRRIVVDDYILETEYVFEEMRNPYDPDGYVVLGCNEYDFSEFWERIAAKKVEWSESNGVITFETDIDPISTNFPLHYDVHSFDSFYNAMEAFYKKGA